MSIKEKILKNIKPNGNTLPKDKNLIPKKMINLYEAIDDIFQSDICNNVSVQEMMFVLDLHLEVCRLSIEAIERENKNNLD